MTLFVVMTFRILASLFEHRVLLFYCVFCCLAKPDPPTLISFSHSDVSVLYRSPESSRDIVAVAMSYNEAGQEPQWTMLEYRETKHTFTNLSPDTLYEIRVSISYKAAEWGRVSEPLRVKTRKSDDRKCCSCVTKIADLRIGNSNDMSDSLSSYTYTVESPITRNLALKYESRKQCIFNVNICTKNYSLKKTL